MTVHISADLLKKFSRPGPRYTSYPTAPEWKSYIHSADYARLLGQLGRSQKSVSVYVHVPFCTSMCYYCGCNVVIRKSKPEVGDSYLDLLEREIKLASGHLGAKPVLKQFHIGGGTPNYLSSSQLTRLYGLIADAFFIESDAEIAIELDPRTVQKDQIYTLNKLGFNRISMGIQDFTPRVQEAVNRIQPFELVYDLMQLLRQLDFRSVNMDLIYGLPYQTLDDFSRTIDQTIFLSPDRIALYSFAHIPWLKSHQKLIPNSALPDAQLKLDLFLQARAQFLGRGYDAIGMDHFAKSSDDMAIAFNRGLLHRNFMGYTLKPADDFIGFGPSSIGFVETAFIQNTKELKNYESAIQAAELPVEKGLILSQDDQIRQWVISELMCHFSLDKRQFQTKYGYEFDAYFSAEQTHLHEMEKEGLLTASPTRLLVTELGRFFVRNIAMGFDWYLRQPKSHQQFSGTI